MFLVMMCYANTQPQNVIVHTTNRVRALAAAIEYADRMNRPLDTQWPGTRGLGVDAAPISKIESGMKKLVQIEIEDEPIETA